MDAFGDAVAAKIMSLTLCLQHVKYNNHTTLCWGGLQRLTISTTPPRQAGIRPNKAPNVSLLHTGKPGNSLYTYKSSRHVQMAASAAPSGLRVPLKADLR
jgi:hypothetical protein